MSKAVDPQEKALKALVAPKAVTTWDVVRQKGLLHAHLPKGARDLVATFGEKNGLAPSQLVRHALADYIRYGGAR